jgi:hypothetical protein
MHQAPMTARVAAAQTSSPVGERLLVTWRAPLALLVSLRVLWGAD